VRTDLIGARSLSGPSRASWAPLSQGERCAGGRGALEELPALARGRRKMAARYLGRRGEGRWMDGMRWIAPVGLEQPGGQTAALRLNRDSLGGRRNAADQWIRQTGSWLP
jgi:hypothetical protein